MAVHILDAKSTAAGPIDPQSSLRGFLPMQLAFALTGIGTTLLGSLLPNLSITWRLNDRHAGLLFAAQFCGSAIGALLVSSKFFRSALRGYFLLTASALSIGVFSGPIRTVLFFTFGLGLGLAMTSTSMWFGSVFPMRRGAVLSTLNAWWCFGAVLSAPIGSVWARRFSAVYLYPILAGAVLLTMVPVLGKRDIGCDPPNLMSSSLGNIEVRRVCVFALIAFLYVGTETSVGGWLMSYVHRLAVANSVLAPLATSFFWLALLAGRTISPWILRYVEEMQLLSSSIFGAFVGVLMLLFLPGSIAIVFSAAAAGLTLGPIFPLCMAKVLALMHDSPNSKWIFAISGFGATLLPAVTGEVSTREGSLHFGLLVPAFALLVMSSMMILDRTGGPKVLRRKASAS